MNVTDIRVAADHFGFQPLRRGSFDRLLPELATWLDATDLETIVRAYMSLAGYDQAQRDEKLPAPVRVPCSGRYSNSIAPQPTAAAPAFSADEARRGLRGQLHGQLSGEREPSIAERSMAEPKKEFFKRYWPPSRRGLRGARDR